MPTLRQSNKEIYWMWKAIKQRCNNPKCKAYHNYGGRGITYTKEWEKFESFYKWVINNGWKKGLDLDRINNDGNYEPNNCRFVSRRENVNNRRMSIYITINNETKPLTEWAEIINVDRGTIKGWIYTHDKKYAKFRIEDALKNGYIYKNYAYGNTKKVKHLESGLIFNSVKEAGEYFNCASCTISNAIRDKRKTRKGTFEFIE